MLFLEYLRKRSCHVPENLTNTGYNFQYFILNLLSSNCILESYETCGSMERNSEISASSFEVPLILPHFVVISQLSHVTLLLPSVICGEPWSTITVTEVHTRSLQLDEMSQYIVILLCQTPDKLMRNYSDSGSNLLSCIYHR